MSSTSNRRRTFGLALSLIAVVALVLALSLSTQAQVDATAPAAERRVCPAGPPACDYLSLQAAVDAAAAGDVIKVAAGNYTDLHSRPSPPSYNGAAMVTQVLYVDKAVTIRGGYASGDWSTPDPVAHPTTLDAQGQGRALFITGQSIGPVIEGLRISGGNAAGLGGGLSSDDDVGGGGYVHLAPAVLRGNVVTSNMAYRGGGLWLAGSGATLSHNTVIANSAEWAGGGLWLNDSAATLEANAVVSNTALYAAGAALLGSAATLRGNEFTANYASEGEGGGLFLSGSNAYLDGNILAGNRVRIEGGGLYVNLSRVELHNTVIMDNRALTQGSGIHVQGSEVTLKHTTLARNGAEGDGIGMYVRDWQGSEFSAVTMTNSIVSGHSGAGIVMTAGNTVALDATLWHANTIDWSPEESISHSHDHYGNPSFAADGYHLTAGSAGIDRGVTAGVTTDLDGDLRPQYAGYDLGADEYLATPVGNPRTYLPLMVRTR